MMSNSNSFVENLIHNVSAAEHTSSESQRTNITIPKLQDNILLCSNVDETVEKSSAVWTFNTTLTLLKLYEKKLEMLETPKKKTRIWIAISESLKDFNIEMTPDQVRWKINALTKKYKHCIDSGQHTKFKYFREMDNIFFQYNMDYDTFNLSIFTHDKREHRNKFANKTKIKMIGESKNMIELRKVRLAKRVECDRSQTKINLERQWLEYLNRQEESKLLQDDVYERNLKLKEEELDLRRQEIGMKESIELHKLQLRDREQEEFLKIERNKYELLKNILLCT